MPQASARRGAGPSSTSVAITAPARSDMRRASGIRRRGASGWRYGPRVSRLAARLVVAAAAVVLAACGAPAQVGPALIPAAEAPALPPLAYPLLSGEPWAPPADRVLVLDVWATYCVPCRKAFPKLDRLAADHPEIAVVGLSVDEDDAVVRRFLDEVPARFPIARDREQTVQSGPLQITRLPTVLVVDRRGRIRVRAAELAEAGYDALPAIVAALGAE